MLSGLPEALCAALKVVACLIAILLLAWGIARGIARGFQASPPARKVLGGALGPDLAAFMPGDAFPLAMPALPSGADIRQLKIWSTPGDVDNQQITEYMSRLGKPLTFPMLALRVSATQNSKGQFPVTARPPGFNPTPEEKIQAVRYAAIKAAEQYLLKMAQTVKTTFTGANKEMFESFDFRTAEPALRQYYESNCSAEIEALEAVGTMPDRPLGPKFSIQHVQRISYLLQAIFHLGTLMRKMPVDTSSPAKGLLETRAVLDSYIRIVSPILTLWDKIYENVEQKHAMRVFLTRVNTWGVYL